jgi:phosphonate transport system permease protein
MLVLSEFKPWFCSTPGQVTDPFAFLGDFFPPVDADFPTMVAQTWRTVAIATAGLTLALVQLAVPLTLLSVQALSVSAPLMALLPGPVRQIALVLTEVAQRA